MTPETRRAISRLILECESRTDNQRFHDFYLNMLDLLERHEGESWNKWLQRESMLSEDDIEFFHVTKHFLGEAQESSNRE